KAPAAGGLKAKADPERPANPSSHQSIEAMEQEVTGTGSEEDPFVTNNVETAAKLLAENRYVRLDRPDEVATLVKKLKEYVDDAKAKGEQAPNYDLCKVSVPGTNLFCVGNKGIPRTEMPQLSGKPSPGTEADAMPKNDKGEVDLGPAFVEHLEAMG